MLKKNENVARVDAMLRSRTCLVTMPVTRNQKGSAFLSNHAELT